MKKLLLLCPALLLSSWPLLTQAQGVRLGLKAGVNYSSVTSPGYEGPTRRFGPVAGVFAQLPLSSDGFLLVQPELLYSAKGSQSTYINGTFASRLHYLDVPVLVKINVDGLFFELGPQVSFLAAARYETSTGTSTSVRGSNRVAAGGAAGVGYQLPMGLGLTLRYTHDLTRLYSLGPRNTVFQAQASYLLGDK
ncbi:porin family protein [Hymenobacter sublimis]|uniref:PorT family protein n=1 Tax=Hymenobacter sublimis TaxID=2933777 RepID=A0ABY4J714_9BACT|nr:porin family protein [Hymenobacter sublimis]UPL48583.1 PorT family protein [Hymenobacter sublimis]